MKVMNVVLDEGRMNAVDADFMEMTMELELGIKAAKQHNQEFIEDLLGKPQKKQKFFS